MNTVICSGTASLDGILFTLDANSIQPTVHYKFCEFYDITAMMLMHHNPINVLGIPTPLELAIIATLMLVSAIADEFICRVAVPRWVARVIDE